MSITGTPVKAGLVGAGPWARMVHAPGLAVHGGVEFTHIWARNAEAARSIADRYDLGICADHSELIRAVDLISYSVPPAVQAPLATAARAAGKAVLLEKPVAKGVVEARHVEHAAPSASSPAVVNYTRLLDARMQHWIADQLGSPWIDARIILTNGAILSGSAFSDSAWRHEADAGLWDLGPHAFSLLVTILGPVASVEAGLADRVVRLCAQHSNGGHSEVVCSVATSDEEAYEFAARDGERSRPSPVVDPAGAFRRALDVLLYGGTGPGDFTASDLRVSTHIVEILAAGSQSIADGARHAVTPMRA
jgi:predicted dehydrogenase